MVGVYLCSRKLPVRLNPLLGIIGGGACVVLAAKRSPLVGFAIGGSIGNADQANRIERLAGPTGGGLMAAAARLFS